MRNTRSRKIDKLSGTIEKLLNARGWAGRLKEYRVLGVWDRCVGSGIAAHAQPVMIRGKKLTVVVDSSAWMQQLSLLRPQIVEKLNRGLGKDSVESISLKLGEVGRREAPSGKRPAEPRALGDEEYRRIDEYVGAIGDEELRERLKRLIEKDLRSRKSAASSRG